MDNSMSNNDGSLETAVSNDKEAGHMREIWPLSVVIGA